MEVKVRNSDVIWNYIGTFFNVCYSILLFPVVLRYLNVYQLGLWYVFTAVSQFTILFDMGFSVTLARQVAYCWSGVKKINKEGIGTVTQDNSVKTELLRKVTLSCYIIYTIISLLTLILLLTIGTIYVNYASGEYLIEEQNKAWIIFVFSVVLGIFNNYYFSLARGAGRIKEINIAQVFSRVVTICICIGLLISGKGILAMAIGNAIASMIVFMTMKHVIDKIYISVNKNSLSNKIVWHDFREVFINIWHNAYKEGIVTISNYINNFIGTFIVSMVGNLEETAMYGITIQIINIIANISQSYNTAIRPTIQSLFARNEKQKVLVCIGTGLVSFYILYFLGTISVLIVGKKLLYFFGSSVSIDNMMYIIIAVYTFLGKNHSMCAAYISDTNNLPYVKPYVISSFGGLALSVYLLKTTNLGVYAYIFSLAFSQIVYNNWKWPQYLLNKLDISYKELIKIGFIEVANRIRLSWFSTDVK